MSHGWHFSLRHAAGLCLIFCVVIVTTDARAGALPRLRVSPDRRSLQTAEGKPFFYLADTGWLLFSRLTREEANDYLEDRRRKGFNVIQAMLVHDMEDVNVYGAKALAGGDVSKPRMTPGSDPADPKQYDYWDHVDAVVAMAEAKGIYMALVPIWGTQVKAGKASAVGVKAYAKWLAARYGNRSNVIWINGGDVRGDVRPAVWNAIGETLRKDDPNHLITFHPFGRTRSSTWFHDAGWLDFNMFQSGHRRYDQDPEGIGEDNWRYLSLDYGLRPIKPTLDGEPGYEGMPHGLHDPKQPRWQAADLRRSAYWSAFAGACGFTYGDNSVMQFYVPKRHEPAYGATMPWRQAMDDPGAGQMAILKDLMLSRSYFDRAPAPEILAGDAGTRHDRQMVLRGKGYAFVYDPCGKPVNVRLGKISGAKIRAEWLNPRDGRTTLIGTFENAGTRRFDPPGEPGEANDWTLILDDASGR